MESPKYGEGTYSLDLRCTNCDHRWTQQIPVGQPFSQYSYYGVAAYNCPRCACNTVVKDIRAEPKWKREGWMFAQSEKDK